MTKAELHKCGKSTILGILGVPTYCRQWWKLEDKSLVVKDHRNAVLTSANGLVRPHGSVIQMREEEEESPLEPNLPQVGLGPTHPAQPRDQTPTIYLFNAPTKSNKTIKWKKTFLIRRFASRSFLLHFLMCTVICFLQYIFFY